MDHTAICNCPFRETCDTYVDPLIDGSMKGDSGFGCAGQDNFYRTRHCKSFRCKALSVLLTDVMTPRPAGPGKAD